MISIDPKISKLLSTSFVSDELSHHPNIHLQEIGLNGWLMERRKCWAAYIPELKKIAFDPTVQPSFICKSVNSRWPELCLQEAEAWAFVLYHEIKHTMGEQSEWSCDRYAMQRIFELRNKNEVERKKFVNVIREVVTKGIRASLRDGN